MTGIDEVARACGFSTATVSRALRGLPNVSPATRAAVQAAADRLGYIASPSATGLASGRHHAIAVVIPSTHRWFDMTVIEGIDSVLRRDGYDMFLINLAAGKGERERLFHTSLLRKRADGVIALGFDFYEDELRELRALAMPSIIIGRRTRGVRNIGVDDSRASSLAMEHLLQLGHTQIGHVGGVDEYGMKRSVGILRHRAWARALTKHGVTVRPEWFASGSFLMPEGKAAALALLTQPVRPTAIFAASDEMAFGVLAAATSLGLAVPDDLSVVGIDDHTWSEAYGLTTVRQDPFAQGVATARALLAEIDDASQRGAKLPMPPLSLIVRTSTRAIRPAAYAAEELAQGA